jgi:hypothetical protein
MRVNNFNKIIIKPCKNMSKYIIILLTTILLGCATTSEKTTKSAESTVSPESITQTETVVKEENLGQNLPIEANVVINDQLIELEIAKTSAQQQIGLMYRTSLADHRGMLFPFSPPRRVSFWMKNVSLDLDMVFLRNGVVQAIESNVPPCQNDPCPTYGPDVEIDQVIELRGGRAIELGLKQGDVISINFL